MTDNYVFMEDKGTEIILDTGHDISAGTIFRIFYKKPNNISSTWVCTLFETTKVRYVTTSTDLDVAGDWILQARVVIPGWSGFGSKVILSVKEHI